MIDITNRSLRHCSKSAAHGGSISFHLFHRASASASMFARVTRMLGPGSCPSLVSMLRHCKRAYAEQHSSELGAPPVFFRESEVPESVFMPQRAIGSHRRHCRRRRRWRRRCRQRRCSVSQRRPHRYFVWHCRLRQYAGYCRKSAAFSAA